jgi:outer membrane immunogenic protein
MTRILLGTTILAGLLISGAAQAADLPAKAPYYKAPVAAPVYNWSGFYVGGHIGYLWADVDDVAVNYSASSRVREWIGGVHGGAQIQFGQNPWGAWVLGIEAAGNFAGDDNSTSNLVPCANPAFSCGLRKIDDLVTIGGRLGIAANTWLFTVSGGYATAKLNRVDFLPASGFCAGGGCSNDRHNGAYVGVGLEHVLFRGGFADIIAGADYQHIWLNDKGDVNQNGVTHNLKADVDIARFRLTAKFNPFGSRY